MMIEVRVPRSEVMAVRRDRNDTINLQNWCTDNDYTRKAGNDR